MKSNLKQVLLPTLGQGLGCLGVSIAMIGYLYRTQIWHRITSGTLSQALSQLNYGQDLAKVTQSPIVHTAVIVAFWSGVGLVAYTVVWSLVNVLIEARNEVVLETEYTNKAAFIQRVKTPLIQLGIATALFASLFLCAKFVFPFWLQLFNSGLNSTGMGILEVDGAAAILGNAITIYLLLVLGQLIFWLG